MIRHHKFFVEPTYPQEFRLAMKALGVCRSEWLVIWERDACPEAHTAAAHSDAKHLAKPSRWDEWTDDYFGRKVRRVMAEARATLSE